MGIVENFFSRKKTGFYIGVVAAILSLICVATYVIGFRPDGELGEYISHGVWILMFFAFLSFAVLSLFKQTSNLAAVAMGVFSLIALLLFIKDGYMYFSTIFYGEVTIAGFFGMNLAYLISMLSLLFVVILSNVCVYLKQEKVENKTTSEVNL